MNSNEFDDLIKNKAYDREANVPEDIWANITAKKKKKSVPFLWLLFVVLLLTAIGVIWQQQNKKNNPGDNNIAEKSKAENTQRVSGNKIVPASEEVQNVPQTKVSVVPNPHQIQIDSINTTTDLGKQTVTTNGRAKMKVNQAGVDSRIVHNGPAAVQSGPASVAINKSSANDESARNNSFNKKVLKQRGRANAHISSGEIDSVGTDAEIDGTTSTGVKEKNGAENSTIVLSSPTWSDSTTTAQKLVSHTDSSRPAATNHTNGSIKKAVADHKKINFKIEFALTKILPMQQYTLPMYVKRIVENGGARSEFMSENITTSIESGSAFSAAIIKDLGKKWSIGVGVQYLRFTELIHLAGVTTEMDPSSTQKSKTFIDGRNAYYNFTLPLVLRYTLVSYPKWKVGLTTGVYLDVVRKYHNDLPGTFEIFNSATVVASTTNNSMGLDAFGGVHFSGTLSKKYEWFAEPGFRYNLSRYNLNELSFNKKVHKAGLSVGVAYNFR